MNIVMPKMGESVNEGTIIKWYKKVGDQVKADEIIFEISTDKVDTEIPSPATGTIKEIIFNEGDTVEVGTIVAIIDSNGEVDQNKVPNSMEDMVKEEKKVEKESDPGDESGKLINIEMPKMGESVMEGTIIKWFKRVGDKVKKDETLFEISTDKVDTEVPSPVDGTVAEILIGEQETVDVGTTVAKISSGDVVKHSLPKKDKQPSLEAEQKIPEPDSMHDKFVPQEKEFVKKVRGEVNRFYSPLVLNIAQKENISFEELKNIIGTGLQGRVSKKDILLYLEKREKGMATPSVQGIEREFSTEAYGSIERIPMNNTRQKIMEHMVKSRDTSVHVTSVTEVDMTRIHNFILQKKDEYLQKHNVKLTYLSFIAEACVKAIKKYPLINSTIEGNNIFQKNFVNLGIAVGIEPTGLIVPNIKNAERMNLIGLANAIDDLAYRARNKKLNPDEVAGGTFSITNYGVFGVVFGTPIINQPEVAILGVGVVSKQPVVVNLDGVDSIAIKQMMALTLSHDHRLVDGMLGGQFLKQMKNLLENFDSSAL